MGGRAAHTCALVFTYRDGRVLEQVRAGPGRAGAIVKKVRIVLPAMSMNLLHRFQPPDNGVLPVAAPAFFGSN
ncbi:hypothetical protein GCM10009836_48280 [Pseudonocardia ailaonensis]|uniref:Uncharacterized protein n=2 Tax=Pseudonocardia ailaonensis TaxID=367279 RepID=A0ABN2NF57_9PSEU